MSIRRRGRCRRAVEGLGASAVGAEPVAGRADGDSVTRFKSRRRRRSRLPGRPCPPAAERVVAGSPFSVTAVAADHALVAPPTPLVADAAEWCRRHSRRVGCCCRRRRRADRCSSPPSRKSLPPAPPSVSLPALPSRRFAPDKPAMASACAEPIAFSTPTRTRGSTGIVVVATRSLGVIETRQPHRRSRSMMSSRCRRRCRRGHRIPGR